MAWKIELHPAFRDEVKDLPVRVRRSLGETLVALEFEGPDLGRPYVDTLYGSRHANMKELRSAPMAASGVSPPPSIPPSAPSCWLEATSRV